jgi:hypothetical protein
MSARTCTGLITAILVCGCGPEPDIPDGEWNVTVTGTADSCTGGEAVYQELFTYQLFFDGSATTIRINNEGFATGTTSGCKLKYESAIWLEEEPAGDFQWQITGEATYEGAAGGCDLPDGVDWEGTETLEIVYSENEAVPEGCSYEMDLTGVFGG